MMRGALAPFREVHPCHPMPRTEAAGLETAAAGLEARRAGDGSAAHRAVLAALLATLRLEAGGGVGDAGAGPDDSAGARRGQPRWQTALALQQRAVQALVGTDLVAAADCLVRLHAALHEPGAGTEPWQAGDADWRGAAASWALLAGEC